MLEDARPTSEPLRADQPTRSADENRDLVERADPATDDRLLPSLDDGITLLEIDDGRGVPVLQSLVLDHLLLNDGPAFWVDSSGHATTTQLGRIAPSRRLLDRIHVARGFTAYQHYGAVRDLSAAVNRSIRRTTGEASTSGQRTADPEQGVTAHTPSLVVAPAVDAQYRDEDSLRSAQAARLQARTLARLRTYAERYDVPVLVTRSKADEFSAAVATAADHRLECTRTRMGPRFVGEEFETLVYPVDGGAHYQTTLAYWQQLLDARARQVGVEPTPPSQSTASVGTGVIADGETASLTPNPLLDAWAGGGR